MYSASYKVLLTFLLVPFADMFQQVMKQRHQHEENGHTGVAHCSPPQDERPSPAVSPDNTLLACTAQFPIPASQRRKYAVNV